MPTSCGSEFVFATETTRCNPLRQTASTSLVLFQLSQEDLHPVPPPGRCKGLNIHAVTLIRLTHADQRAQRALQTSYRRYPTLPAGAGRKLGYADWSILLLSLLQALWQLSQEQVVG